MRVPGHPDANPRVLEYLRVVGLPRRGMDDDEPWCSAFANWSMLQVGMRGSMGGLARGWLRWGQPMAQPVFGAVAVLNRPPNPANGHVAFYVGRQRAKLLLLGGNQRIQERRVNLKSIVSLSAYDDDRLIGFRWPAGFAVPRDGSAPKQLFPLVPP